MVFKFIPRYSKFGLICVVLDDVIQLSYVSSSVYSNRFFCCINLHDKLEQHVGIFESCTFTLRKND
jgi:hypothetical protein